jgi:hypothetical protein
VTDIDRDLGHPAADCGLDQFDRRPQHGAVVHWVRDGPLSVCQRLRVAAETVVQYRVRQQPLSETLRQHGYAPDEATAAAQTLLPDILSFDRTMPAHYPNGRSLTDDVFSARMAFMTHGGTTPQGVKPHDDLLDVFPFLGMPNP